MYFSVIVVVDIIIVVVVVAIVADDSKNQPLKFGQNLVGNS